MSSKTLKLYHTSSAVIESPDVNYGRRNADFGGGFYTSDSAEFSRKWASERKAVVNRYTLDLTGLNVRRFERDSEWFDYIFKNRAGYADAFADADVIIGPIANDTIYDTFGIITSGLLGGADALRLLEVGKEYTQINIKSEKAAAQLKWEGGQTLGAEEIAASRSEVRAEEAEFREAFLNALKGLDCYAEIMDIIS